MLFPVGFLFILKINLVRTKPASGITKRLHGFIKELKPIDTKLTFYHNSIQLYRKCSFALIMVVFKDVPSLQVQLITLNCLLSLLYLVKFKPFFERKKNNIEIANESLILLTAYTFICLSQGDLMKPDTFTMLGFF